MSPKDVRLLGVEADGFSGYETDDGSAGLTISPNYDETCCPTGEK